MLSGPIPWVLAAAASNVVTVLFLKPSKGFTVPVPTMLVLGSIWLCHYFLARAVTQDHPAGLAGAVVLNVTLVSIAAGLIGYFQGDRTGPWQLVGYALAIVGIVLALLAPGSTHGGLEN